MSSSPDPQTWVFPPLGAAVLPSDVSASFGPISQGDKIKLEWAPASSTPDVAFICANDGTTFVASSNKPSPAIVTFDQSINNGSSHMCWFFFPGTSLGNTLTFEYNNQGTGSSVLWEQDSQLAQAMSGGGSAGTSIIISTVTSTATVTKTAKPATGTGNNLVGGAAAASTITLTETETETITQRPSTLLTTIANPSTTFVSTSVQFIAQSTGSPSAIGVSASQPAGLGAGAAAGITAAAITVLALLLLLGSWLYRRHSKKNAAVAGAGAGGGGAGPGVDVGPVVVPTPYKFQPDMQQQQQMQQGQPLMHGYYHPGNEMDAPLPQLPRRTIHEIGA